MPAIVGQHLAAMGRGLIRPDVETRDERFRLEPLFERRRDGLQIERFGLHLADAKEDVDVRRPERVLQALRHAVGRFLTQLAQHDGRRLAELADGSELEVEEDCDRDGDRHGESDREPQAAIAHHRLTADGPTLRPAFADSGVPWSPFGRDGLEAYPALTDPCSSSGSPGTPGSASPRSRS